MAQLEELADQSTIQQFNSVRQLAGVAGKPYGLLFAKAPDGRLVSVEIGYEASTNGEATRQVRVFYLDGTAYNGSINALVFQNFGRENGLSHVRQTVTTAFANLSAIPSLANKAIIQSSAPFFYNKDAGAGGYLVAGGATFFIEGRNDILSAQLAAQSGNANLYVQYFQVL